MKIYWTGDGWHSRWLYFALEMSDSGDQNSESCSIGHKHTLSITKDYVSSAVPYLAASHACIANFLLLPH